MGKSCLVQCAFICLMNVFALGTEAAEPPRDFTAWASGSGNWTNAAHWSDGLPDPFRRVEIHGDSTVIVPPGTCLVGDLEIGFNAGDRSRVEVDGGQLIVMQDSLRVGELTGGEGEFVLKQGALHDVMDVFVGAANSVSGRETKGTLRVQGGSFVGRTLIIGSGPGRNPFWPSKDPGLQPSTCWIISFFKRSQIQMAKGANPRFRSHSMSRV